MSRYATHGFLCLVLLMVSCSGAGDTSQRKDPDPGPAATEITVQKQDKKIEDQKKVVESTEDPLAKAKEEKRLAQLELDKLKTLLADKENQIASIDADIKRQTQEAWKLRCYIAAGSFLAIAAVLVFLALYMRVGAMLTFAGYSTLAAALCFAGGMLVPYLIWIVWLVVAGFIGWMIWALVNREKALKQVTKAINEAKGDLDTATGKIPLHLDDYRQHFRQFIDEPADKLLNSIRSRHNLD